MAWIEDHLSYAGDECIAWPFTKSKEGYGRIWAYGRMYPSYRLMCELAHGGPENPDLQAAHSCGNGRFGCMNPKHLRWATRAENEADKKKHGTVGRGAKNPAAKLSDFDVEAIREIAPYATQATLCRHYGISSTQISRIVNGKRWAA